MLVILTLFIVFLILISNELLWRKKDVHGEFSRKFVHVTVGSFVAVWPFYLSWLQIEIIGLAFLVVVTLSKILKIFQAIHSVQRPTWGEAFFALSVVGIALITHNKWIYAASLLQMSLADGLAAVIGMRYGRRQSYLIFNHTKSVLGTLTFFVVSAIVLIGFTHYSGISLSITRLLLVSAGAALLENLAAIGLDNFLVPLYVALLLINN